MASALEKAKHEVEVLLSEREKLMREVENSPLDHKQYHSLLLELEEARAEMKSVECLRQELIDARDTIDVQSAELAEARRDLVERHGGEGATSPLTGRSVGDLEEEVGRECLSLEEEMRGASNVSFF